jgi:hypothetical protein
MNVDQAISRLSQADPLVKLLQEVRLGRMKPTDAGLRAITGAWLDTYRQVLGEAGLDRESLRRLDPGPRLEMLIAAGILMADDAAVASLRAAYESTLQTPR